MSLIDTPVGSVMTKAVRAISGDRTLAECVDLMKTENIGSVVVLESGRPVGIFTERWLTDPRVSSSACTKS